MTPDITIPSLLLLLGLLIPVILANRYLGMTFNKKLIISVVRMIVQMALVGIYLQYIFNLNNAFINIGYLLLMILVATYTSIRSSKLKLKRMAMPMFLAILIPQFALLMFFNVFVVRIDFIFDARFLVTVGGMLLGNCMRADIIAVNSFYDSIRSGMKNYEYSLALGASKLQAYRPYLQQAVTAATEPVIATMTTLGLVSLPGMMTGQILGGSVPLLAIKYQIAIMIAIFVAIFFSTLLAIYFSQKRIVDGYGRLDKSVFNG